MARSIEPIEDIKAFFKSQVYNEDKWASNKKLLCALGLFAGSIVFMRSYGDIMAI